MIGWSLALMLSYYIAHQHALEIQHKAFPDRTPERVAVKK